MPRTGKVSEAKGVGHQRRDIGRAGIDIHRDHRHQHQQRAEEGVEEELEGRVDAVLAAPDADDQEHRDQAALEEEVEEHQVQRGEDAEHQRFQHQEGDHVFLHPHLHVPAGGDGDRHQEGGEHHEEDRDAVHAHLVFQPQQPLAVLDELEAGVVRIEPAEQEERDEERRRGGDQRQPLGVALRGLILAPEEQREDQRRDQRQEDDDGDQVLHGLSSPRSSSRRRGSRCLSPWRRRSGRCTRSGPAPRGG